MARHEESIDPRCVRESRDVVRPIFESPSCLRRRSAIPRPIGCYDTESARRKLLFERDEVQAAHRRAMKEEEARAVDSSEIGVGKRSVPGDDDLRVLHGQP